MRMDPGYRETITRDYLDALCLISRIANFLYPEMPMAADRERKLLQIPEMQRLSTICERKCRDINKELGSAE